MPVQDRYQTFVPDQREFFDELIVEDWATYQSADWDASRRFEVDELFKRIQPRTVLDMGCGCGWHDAEMANHSFVERVDSFDYSARSIEKADEAYPHEKAHRFVADLATFAPERQYDLVVSFQVFEHLNDTDAYWASAERGARHGGHVAIFTPNRNRLSNVLLRLRGKPPAMLDPQHFREYSPRELMKMGGMRGLVPVTWFAVSGLGGLPVIDRLPIAKRLALGARLPSVANGFCALFLRP